VSVWWSSTDYREASAAVERAKINRDVGPCPFCGAAADIDMIDVSTAAGTSFIPGEVRCSAQCWRNDPEGYVAAVKRARGAA
jgi:hypothetical protein